MNNIEEKRKEIEQFFQKYETDNLDIKCTLASTEDCVHVNFYFYRVKKDLEKSTFDNIINEYQRENPQYMVVPYLSDTWLNNEMVYFCTIYFQFKDATRKVYETIKQYTNILNFPTNKYVVVGLLALWAALTNGSYNFDKYFEESVHWFNKSLELGENIKTSAYAIATLAPNLDISNPLRKELYTKACKLLDEESEQKVLDLIKQIELNKGNPENIEKIQLQELEYIANLIEKETGEKVGDYSWTIKLKK